MDIVNLEHVEHIAARAFYKCGLRRVRLSSKTKNVHPLAFEGCPLEFIEVSSDNKWYSSIDGVLFKNNGEVLSLFPPNLNHGDPIHYDVPDGVTAIGELAFENCENLVEINFPDSLRVISQGAFKGCRGLKSIVLPEGLKKIKKNAMESCSIEEIHIPASVESILSPSFDCPNLKTITVDEKNAAYVIDRGVLYNKGMTELILCPRCNMDAPDRFEVPRGVRTIQDGAFCGCHLKEVAIPSSVEEIREGAFMFNKDLENVTFQSGILSIFEDSFKGCDKLSSVWLPETLRYLGKDAFPFSCEVNRIIDMY